MNSGELEKEIEEKSFYAKILEGLGLAIGVTGLIIGVVNWQRAVRNEKEAARNTGAATTESFGDLKVASIVAFVASVVLLFVAIAYIVRRRYKKSKTYLRRRAQKWGSVNYEGKKLTKREELLNTINTLRYQAAAVPETLKQKQSQGVLDDPIIELYKITKQNIVQVNRRIREWKSKKKNAKDIDNPDFEEIKMEEVPGF
jgi:hypothetical protein